MDEISNDVRDFKIGEIQFDESCCEGVGRIFFEVDGGPNPNGHCEDGSQNNQPDTAPDSGNNSRVLRSILRRVIRQELPAPAFDRLAGSDRDFPVSDLLTRLVKLVSNLQIRKDQVFLIEHLVGVPVNDHSWRKNIGRFRVDVHSIAVPLSDLPNGGGGGNGSGEGGACGGGGVDHRGSFGKR